MLFFKKKSAPAAAPAKGETSMTDKPVMLYALSTCGHCNHTKQLLDQLGVKYDFAYVDKTAGEERQHLIDKVKEYNPQCSFPTLLIGETVIVGYKEKEIKEALGV